MHLPEATGTTGALELHRSRRRFTGHLSHLLTRKRPVVLAYHDVTDVDLFRRQMDHVRSELRPIGRQDLLDARAGSRPLPPRCVLVTFDDADRTVYERAMPILAERGIPAIVFVVSGVIGTRRPLWFYEVRELLRRGAASPLPGARTPDEVVRQMKQLPNDERVRLTDQLRASASEPVEQPQLTPGELRELDAAGIEVGNHTHSHPCLDRCSDAAVADELHLAHAALVEWLGRSPGVFAYPNGNGDPRAEAVLGALGYEAAFLFDHRIGALATSEPFRISRVRVNSTTPMRRFRSILSGLHPLVHHAIGRR